MRWFLSLLSTLILVVLLCSPALAKDKMVMAFSEFPPFKIVHDGVYMGVDVDLSRLIAERMGLELEIKQGTFAECMDMLRKGEADFITSLLRRGDRDAFLIYVQPRYRNREAKRFYMRKGEEAEVISYDKLSGLRIGVKEGVAYAQMFDTDDSLTKVSASGMEQLFQMLREGRIDAVLASANEGGFWIKSLALEEAVAPAPFELDQLDPVYMAISKKSPLAKRAHEFGRILKELVDTGEFENILDVYMGRAG